MNSMATDKSHFSMETTSTTVSKRGMTSCNVNSEKFVVKKIKLVHLPAQNDEPSYQKGFFTLC
jgi:hypothetical protein